jgi:SAM-dependent methyltransferase
VTAALCGVRPGGTVLDVACGSGRHLRLALERGLCVVGVDRTLDGVADLQGRPGVELVAADLETGGAWPLGARRFDGVVVTNYLWRPILRDIVSSVGGGGVLVYETFAEGNGRHGRPSNPDFLLAPGELLAAVAGRLMPIAYAHATLDDPARIVQRIVAVAPDHDWLIDPPKAGIAMFS